MIKYYVWPLSLSVENGVEVDGIRPTSWGDLVWPEAAQFIAINPEKTGFKQWRANHNVMKVITDYQAVFDFIETNVAGVIALEDLPDKSSVLNDLSNIGVDITGLPSNVPLVAVERRIMQLLQNRDASFVEA